MRIRSAIGWCVMWAMGLSVAHAQGAQGFDLFVLDTQTGSVSQVTNTPDSDEYNASFSPNGRLLIHDVYLWNGSGMDASLAVTAVRSGRTWGLNLPGADNGSWSRDGRYIAYEDASAGSIAVVSATRGTLALQRAGASWPAWSPDGRRLAFRDSASGAIGTTTLSGVETSLAAAGAFGTSPNWSPTGAQIVFQDASSLSLKVVPVTRRGVATGDAYAITTPDHYATVPHFSPDGRTLVYAGTSPGSAEFGLYTVSVFGGSPVVLYDAPGKPEYDPAYSPNGRYVVFSSLAGP